MAYRHRVDAPGDKQHHHHGDQLHDVQGFFAGIGNALGVLPPKIKSDDNGKARCDEIDSAGGERPAYVEVLQEIIDEPSKVLAGGDAADRAGQDVVEHERGDAEFCKRSAESHFHGAIHATAHEHAAAFYVHRA